MPKGFTPNAQKILAFAREEADRLNHGQVCTAHLLLGITRLREGMAIKMLEAKGVELAAIRGEVEKLVEKDTCVKTHASQPYTPRAKKVLTLSERAAVAVDDTYVGTDHLLLALLKEGYGLAYRVLASLGLEYDDMVTVALGV